MREFVDIAFHEEGILRGADRAPEHHRHMRVLQHAADADIRDLVAGGGEALHRLRFDAVLHFADADRTHDRTDGNAGVEGRRQPVGAERCFQAHGGLRPVAVVTHVLFARPHQLHRLADLLGDQNRLAHFVIGRAAAETTAEEAIVDDDLLRLQAGSSRSLADRAHRRLGAEPDLELVGLQTHRGVERLHGGMCQMRRLIDGFDHLAAFWRKRHRHCRRCARSPSDRRACRGRAWRIARCRLRPPRPHPIPA